MRTSLRAPSFEVRIRAFALAAGMLAAAVIPVHAAAASTDTADDRRIVSIGGAVTEVLYALGVEDRIVGVDSTSLYPLDAQEKAGVGYMRALSPEGVLSLSPDLILMEDGSGPPPAVTLLDAAGIDIVHVPSGHDAKAVAEKIRTVAQAVGKEAEGDRIASGLEAGLDDLAADLSTIDDKRRVLFILSMADGRLTAGGAGTGGDAIIKLAGGVNVFGGTNGYKTLSSEALAELSPDVVLMMDRGGSNHGAGDPFSIPALKATPAGRSGALIRMDALYLLGFGPRTADAARDLASRLYPDEAALRE